MKDVSLIGIVMLLAAAALAAPLAKVLRIGSVLGYLFAGVALGPYGIGQAFSSRQAEDILHFAEFGVVLLLFLIGLELRPKRVWSMRTTIGGLGGAQVTLSAVVLAVAGTVLGLPLAVAVFTGLALSLSSTAFALQVLEENGELTARHGRLAFAVLLFQDLAAIPLIALTPLFAVGASEAAKGMDLTAALIGLLTIAGVVVVGRYVLDRLFRLVARAKVREAMTALALMTVVGVAAVMEIAGLSPALGAFIAGALLAKSSYRHQLEADIKPFEGLLLGLFFTAIGMSLNLNLLLYQPGTILALALGLVLAKSAVSYVLGLWQNLEPWASRRFALSISQGGEFAFVLFAAGVAAGVLAREQADLLAVVVTLSMIATPFLLLLDEALGPKDETEPVYERPPENDAHVIVAGFGRFGQIVARILRARRIPFTALDINAEQIEFVSRFGSKAFFGDASRPDILAAAQADKARALVIAIDDVEASMRLASYVRGAYPNLKIYARARNRNHVHRLMDLGIKAIRRETYLASIDLTRELLRGLGFSERDVKFTIETFRTHDERRLMDDYEHYTDAQKIMEKARGDAENLAKLFDEDAREQARLQSAENPKPGGCRMSRIICVGHAALDRIYRIDAFPPEPGKVRALEHVESGGGMAANAAAAIARLGGKVELWSRTGDDDAGTKIRAGLKSTGVDVRYVQPFEDARSSTSAIIVDGRGDRLIVGMRDATMPSSTSWLPLERIKEASAVLCDLRWLEATRVVFEQARKHKVPTVLDADVGAREALSELLALADYAIFSEPSLDDFSPGRARAEQLAQVRTLGVRHAGVTLGRDGYVWTDDAGGGSYPAFKVAVVDTTGCGDAFHGAFTLALSEGKPTGGCVPFACGAAALKCSRLGSRAGLATRRELEAFLADRVSA